MTSAGLVVQRSPQQDGVDQFPFCLGPAEGFWKRQVRHLRTRKNNREVFTRRNDGMSEAEVTSAWTSLPFWKGKRWPRGDRQPRPGWSRSSRRSPRRQTGWVRLPRPGCQSPAPARRRWRRALTARPLATPSGKCKKNTDWAPKIPKALMDHLL